MKFKKVLLLQILISTALWSEGLDLDGFKLSSYGLKSYNLRGDLKSEVSYTANNNPTKIARYYYNDKDLLTKIEYYAIKSSVPEYKSLLYKKNRVIETRSYNTAGRIKFLTKHFYNDDVEIKKEHYDSRKSLRSSQVNYYNGNNLISKTEYIDGKNNIFQHNIYHYDNAGRELKVEIYKKGELFKTYKCEYDSNGNKKVIYYYNQESVLNMIQVNSFDKNNRLIEFRIFKKN